MEIPTWLEANRNVANKTANPIDVFINNNEPEGAEAERKFRDELVSMLDYVRGLTPRALDDAEVCDCGEPFPESGACIFCGARARHRQ